MANPLSGLSGFSDDVNDLSFRLEGDSVEAVTSDDVNGLSLRLEGVSVEVATSDDVNDLGFRFKGETVEAATSDDIDDLSFRLEGKTVEEATNRVFKISDTYSLFDLKELVRTFGVRCNLFLPGLGNIFLPIVLAVKVPTRILGSENPLQ